MSNESLMDIIDEFRPLLNALAGVNRVVTDVCGGCGHEISILPNGFTEPEHVCPPKPVMIDKTKGEAT